MSCRTLSGPSSFLKPNRPRCRGQWLSERLGQQFVIENRPGAGTNIATEAVVTPPDGYTLLLACLPNASNATLYDKLNLNFIRDIAPVAGIARDTFAIEVNPSMPVKTVPELIAYAKVNSGKINMASGGIGSGNHIFGELFKMMTGVNLVHVPYRGAGPALVDLLGGQVQVMFASMSSSIEYVRAGKLRALAVTTSTRPPVLPDIPTVAEFVPGYEASFWTGVGAPRNTPIEIVEKLSQEINAGLAEFPNEGAARRVGRHRTSRLPRRLRQAHRRGKPRSGARWLSSRASNRSEGPSDQPDIFHNVPICEPRPGSMVGKGRPDEPIHSGARARRAMARAVQAA
jgi:tripartite-type tricarboxylate transporter receptor subunit TctC